MSKRQLVVLLLTSVWLNFGLVAFILTEPPQAAPRQPSAEVAATTSPATAEAVQRPAAGSYPLLRVIDGDTLVVGVGDRSESVRLIGIDTPELSDPGGPECYAQEARKYLEGLAAGVVTLTFDATQGERDRFNRLLAYVANTEGDDLGLVMLRDGYATEYTYATPYERREQYRAAESEALQNKRGLWADDACAN